MEPEKKTRNDHRKRVLLVEDDHSLKQLLAEELEEAGFSVQNVSDAEEALPLLSGWEPDLVISDLKLPGADGMELLEWTKNLYARPGFLIITAFGSIAQAVTALKSGADDFLTKPLDLDHLRICVDRILENRRLQEEVRRVREIMHHADFHGMIGRSRAMRVMLDQIKKIAAASGPVLIQGESGVGKELVAKSLHSLSPRSQAPFLAINCAGIPAELLESEFFGHEAGAFTGAVKKREGLFLRADHGTLMLDEIGEMSYNLQSKLLRVLEDGSFRPVGSSSEHRADVRIICATNRDLEEMTSQGGFREDLFFRLETFSLKVPPLREREGDIRLLAVHFLNRYNLEMGKEIKGFTDEALRCLQEYPFPGNVRELQNAIERAVTFCSGPKVDAEHLPTRIRQIRKRQNPLPPMFDRDFRERLLGDRDVLPSLDELKRLYVKHVLNKVNGNKRRAAAVLGISRRTMYRMLDQYRGETTA